MEWHGDSEKMSGNVESGHPAVAVRIVVTVTLPIPSRVLSFASDVI